MEIGPIIRAMLRNKLGLTLIAVQIAFTMTVVVNAIYIINERSSLMARPSGLDESSLFYLRSRGFQDQFSEEAAIVEDRALLQSMPGIVSMSVMNAIPLSGSGSSIVVWTEPDPTRPTTPTAYYQVDQNAIETMGLELIAGENFTEADMEIIESGDNTDPVKAIISAPLAQELFPGSPADAVGRTYYMSRAASTVPVIGVVRQLQAPWTTWSGIEQSMTVPRTVIDGQSLYLVRTEPGQLNAMVSRVEEALADSNPTRLIDNTRTLPEAREESYRVDRSMSRILLVAIVTLVFITSMGIVGLAVYGINQRRKQIGTRRALGATQGEIIRYFLVENLLISTIGVSLGAVLTVGFNVFLVQAFNMPRMDWYYTPLGMAVLLGMGLLAVLGPSRSAARVPPALATRTV